MSWLPVPRRPPTCHVSRIRHASAGTYMMRISGGPSSAIVRTSPSSSTRHMKNNVVACRHPDTSDQRPDTRYAPFSTIARPVGRVELAYIPRASPSSSDRASSDRKRPKKQGRELFHTTHATEASAPASSSYTSSAVSGSASSPPSSVGSAMRHSPESRSASTIGSGSCRCSSVLARELTIKGRSSLARETRSAVMDRFLCGGDGRVERRILWPRGERRHGDAHSATLPLQAVSHRSEERRTAISELFFD
jgi:hypothetical protein